MTIRDHQWSDQAHGRGRFSWIAGIGDHLCSPLILETTGHRSIASSDRFYRLINNLTAKIFPESAPGKTGERSVLTTILRTDISHLNDPGAVRTDIFIHGIAITLAAIALTFTQLMPVIIYCAAVLVMFIFSAGYNLLRKWWLRRLDHASICFLAVTTCNSFIPPTAPAIPYIAAGSAIYLVGVQFLITPQIRFHNAIWHVFVILAAAFHYEALLIGVENG